MEKLNKLSLPATILIVSLVLGGFFYASEVSKQKSIEKQQQIKIDQQRQEQMAKDQKEQEAKELETMNKNKAKEDEQQVKRQNGQLLNTCLLNTYRDPSVQILEWKNWALENCETFPDITVQTTCYEGVLEDIEKIKRERKEARDECFKKYPQ